MPFFFSSCSCQISFTMLIILSRISFPELLQEGETSFFTGKIICVSVSFTISQEEKNHQRVKNIEGLVPKKSFTCTESKRNKPVQQQNPNTNIGVFMCFWYLHTNTSCQRVHAHVHLIFSSKKSSLLFDFDQIMKFLAGFKDPCNMLLCLYTTHRPTSKANEKEWKEVHKKNPRKNIHLKKFSRH